MNPIQITTLKCEYQENPLGIDVARPRFSWQLASDRPGARQTAYQIQVATSQARLGDNRADLWDSGKIVSDQSVHVVYEGKRLGSGERAWWTVRVWDENDEVVEADAPAFWETGLLDRGDWQGTWIGAALAGGPHTTIPCPFLRKTFALDQPVASARLYVTALGLYEFYLNGRRVGENVFAPGWTDYNKRVQYQTYDVTGLLRAGPNACGAILGDGWYCGHVAWRNRQCYGDRPKLLAQLVIRFGPAALTPASGHPSPNIGRGDWGVRAAGGEGGEGQTLLITTDDSWTVAFGPLLEADLLMGESYDARLELGDWSSPGYDEQAFAARWLPAQTFADPGVRLVASPGPPVRVTQEIMPIADPIVTAKWPAADCVFDLGQNLVGRVRLKVKGEAGTTLRLRFAEVLRSGPAASHGPLYTDNLRAARQTDYYTLRGDPDGEVYEPHFTFHGFRYVEVSGFPHPPSRDAVTGIVLHSDTPPTGTFECSDPLINQLQQNIDWGQRGNFVDIPTDCPQRDERLGWTGDAQVFIRTAAFNRDVAAFFTKWQQDLADAQADEGAFPSVAPNPGASTRDGGPAWADAGIICPWTVYLVYGDTRLLADHYESMARFLAYLETTSRDHIRCYDGYGEFAGYGDWLALDGSGKTEGATPKDLIGTAFFAHDADRMGRIATVLGKHDDAARYERLFHDVKAAFNQRFVTPGGVVASGTQTAYVLALYFDLLPAPLRPAASEALVRDIQKRGNKLSTGFVGSPYLNHVLTDAGRLEVAYALLHQKSWPSWLYAVTQGATTIWERWDGWTHDKGFQDVGMNSFNHYAYGAIGAWLYQCVAGIDVDPDRPGYKHSVLRPRPGGELTSARATFRSLYGTIVSDWRIEKEQFHWSVVVPANTTATAYFPAQAGGEVRELSSGSHAFTLPLSVL